MRKSLGAFVLLSCLVAGVGFAQNASDEEYIKAMQVADPCAKVAALKAWLGKYAGKGAQYENFANAWITLTPCKTTPAAESIQAGEKALALGGIDDATKVQLLTTLAMLEVNAGQTDKAKATAQQLTELGRTNREKDPGQAAQWTKIMGAGYYLQGQAAEKVNDYSGAADAYIQSYTLLKDPKIAAQLRKLGKTLYDQKQYAAAEKIYRQFYATAKDSESAVLLGQTLYRSGKTDEALAIFKEAYAQKRTGELAYNIGIIEAKQAQAGDATAATEAINHLIEASFLYPAQSQNAMNLAQSLYFTAQKDVKYNQIATQMEAEQKKLDEMTKAYNAKFGGKNEEDLSDSEKADMAKQLAAIDAQKQAISKLEAEQKVYIEKFNALVAQVKTRLGK